VTVHKTGVDAAVAPGADGTSAPIKPKVYSKRQWFVWLGVTIAVGLVPAVINGDYSYNIAINSSLYMLLSLGFYWQFALGGQFSFATPAYYAIGAYVAAWAPGGFLAGFVLAILAAGALGMVTKLLFARCSLITFAIATLAFGQLVIVALTNWTSFTGGQSGKFGIPLPSISGYAFDTPTREYYLCGAIVMLGVALIIAFERSPGQRDLVFIRDMGLVARTAGLRVSRVQIFSFGVGAAYMGAAGSLLAHTTGFVGIDSFPIQVALTVLLMVLLGGIGMVWGPMIGAVALTVLPQILSRWLNYEDLLYALAILVVILVLPGGLTSLPSEYRFRREQMRRTSARRAERSAARAEEAKPPVPSG